MSFKKLMVPISNRSNYTKLKKTLKMLQQNQDIEILIVASSALVYSKKTSGYYDIIDDGYEINYHVDCAMMNDSLANMSKSAALSMIEHSTIIEKEEPNAILIIGDRFDMLPACLAARNANIPILHIQGGEQSGTVDDTIRDIISVCAKRHYVATEGCEERVKNITGAREVYNYGCPAVEMIEQMDIGPYLDIDKFKKHYKNSFGIEPHEKYLVVIVHPNTDDDCDTDMSAILSASISFGLKTVVIFPNIDAYHGKIEQDISTFKNDIIRVRHMPVEDFIPLMAYSSCMIGNSSASIREAGSFGTPVVNIGNRQHQREQNLGTINCNTTFEEVKKAIAKSLEVGRYEKKNIYSKLNCTENIVKNICEFLSCHNME
jgi:UDP-hydrolysing UDP-N-acetyl-D-glucosamine 2-epimerase